LPDPSVITELAKTADKISIYFKGVCGKNDFRYPYLKEANLPAEMAGDH
jgi:hypothetical protein